MTATKTSVLPPLPGWAGPGKDNACNVLITLLLDDDPEIRSASASALGDLGDPRAHTLLMHHLGVEKDERDGSGHQGRCG